MVENSSTPEEVKPKISEDVEQQPDSSITKLTSKVQAAIPTSLQKLAEMSRIKGKKVLMVDDEVLLLKLHARWINAATEGHAATIHTLGITAATLVELIINENPDVILMDYSMYQYTGANITSLLRAQGFTKPIIGFSGTNDEKTQKAFTDAGANGSLSKDSLDYLGHVEAIGRIIKTKEVK